MALPVRMADSTTPWLIPEIFRAGRNGVAAYADGTYKWSAGMYAVFPRKRSITTQRGNPDAARAAIMDVERFDWLPADVPGFYRARKAASADAQVIVYCDRSTVEDVMDAMRAGNLDPDGLLWWIAWPLPEPPTQGQVATELGASWHALVPVSAVWACQWRYAGHYDESVVYGPPEWMTT